MLSLRRAVRSGARRARPTLRPPPTRPAHPTQHGLATLHRRRDRLFARALERRPRPVVGESGTREPGAERRLELDALSTVCEGVLEFGREYGAETSGESGQVEVQGDEREEQLRHAQVRPGRARAVVLEHLASFLHQSKSASFQLSVSNTKFIRPADGDARVDYPTRLVPIRHLRHAPLLPRPRSVFPFRNHLTLT